MAATRIPPLTLSHARRALTHTVMATNERGEAAPTEIAGELPLTLYVDRREIVTLMTLGQAPEALAIGYAQARIWRPDLLAWLRRPRRSAAAGWMDTRLGSE